MHKEKRNVKKKTLGEEEKLLKRRAKRKQDNHSKVGAGGWFKINDLHEGKKEEERGEGEKEGTH